ncbi:unnamed protein product [Rhizophagus irregularis]|nr:unnamed protein product [Rhizophagus irregularis]
MTHDHEKITHIVKQLYCQNNCIMQDTILQKSFSLLGLSSLCLGLLLLGLLSLCPPLGLSSFCLGLLFTRYSFRPFFFTSLFRSIFSV